MDKNHVIKLSALAVATTLALTACGGDSSSNKAGNKTPKTATGTFLDSAVEGLEVIQNGKSIGKTDAKGQFTYTVGAGAVSFKLGELTLGSTMPKSVITPADLTTDRNQTIRTLQLLQSIDKDNKLDNGIQIDETLAKRFVSTDFKPLLQETNDTLFETALKPKLNTNQFVVNEKKAIDHFAQTAQSQTVSNAPELSKLADNFVGYWQQSCDEGSQEVLQLAKGKSPNTLVLVGKVLTRKYQNTDCTGSYTDGYDDSSQDQELSTPQVIAQTTNAKNQRVIHFLDVETNDKGEKENVYGSVTWVNNNTFTTEDLTFTRVSKLAFENVVVPPTNNQEIEKAVNSVVGYWQSACMANDDPSDTRGKSIQWFAQFEKMSNDTITTTKSVGVFFSNANCTGTTYVVSDISGETHHTLSDPKSSNGTWNFAATNSHGDRLTIINPNTFTFGDDTLSRSTADVVNGWANKANVVKDNNKTVPVVTDLTFTPASNGKPAYLTAKFNTDMLDDYYTTGSYEPTNSYWLDRRTFVVEFESYTPNGTITLRGMSTDGKYEGFQNSGGIVLPTPKTFTFPQ